MKPIHLVLSKNSDETEVGMPDVMLKGYDEASALLEEMGYSVSQKVELNGNEAQDTVIKTGARSGSGYYAGYADNAMGIKRHRCGI